MLQEQPQQQVNYMDAVTSQPGLGVRAHLYESPTGVTVRTMTSDDAEFAGRLLVDAFESKFVHATGRENLGLVYEASIDDQRLNSFKYNHILIAEVSGQRAGVVELKFHGQSKHVSSGTWERLSCCPLIRLGCMGVMANESVARGRCYVDYICVAEGYRGKGIGQALLTAADQMARERQCHTIYLAVATVNRARNLYLRHGYQVTDTSSWCCFASCVTGYKSFETMEKRLDPVES